MLLNRSLPDIENAFDCFLKKVTLKMMANNIICTRKIGVEFLEIFEIGLRLSSVNIVLKMMANRAGTASALSNPLRSDAEESQWSCKYLMQVAFVKSFKNSTEQG